jgi:hypothetical protein
LMTDADGLLAARFAATRDGHDDSDWSNVLDRVNAQAVPVRRWRLALVAAAVLLAIALPTLALSASVRGLIGLAGPPSPDYRQARLVVSDPLPGGQLARVWASPSKSGGECEFVTIDAARSKRPPSRMTGGGNCSLGQPQSQDSLTWSFSSGPHPTPLIHGRVGANLHASRIELHWHGGRQRLAFSSGFFVASAPPLKDPPFRQLPYEVVAYDTAGHVVARSPIPTSLLYPLDWKRVQPQLHQYRIAHGCSIIPVWRCKSR